MNFAKQLKQQDKSFFGKLVKQDNGYTDEAGKPSVCWEYSGTTFSNGYGRVFNKKLAPTETRAHRYSYILAHGEIPELAGESALILHKCDVRKCCNPKHLYAASHRQNMRDMTSRDRAAKGENSRSLLKNEEVALVKLLSHLEFSYKAIVEMTLLSKSVVARFAKDESWQHVQRMPFRKQALTDYIVKRQASPSPLCLPKGERATGSNAASTTISVATVRGFSNAFGQVETAKVFNTTRKKIRMILAEDDSIVYSVDPKTRNFIGAGQDKKAKARLFILSLIGSSR